MKILIKIEVFYFILEFMFRIKFGFFWWERNIIRGKVEFTLNCLKRHNTHLINFHWSYRLFMIIVFLLYIFIGSYPSYHDFMRSWYFKSSIDFGVIDLAWSMFKDVQLLKITFVPSVAESDFTFDWLFDQSAASSVGLLASSACWIHHFSCFA